MEIFGEVKEEQGEAVGGRESREEQVQTTEVYSRIKVDLRLTLTDEISNKHKTTNNEPVVN